MDEMTLKIGPVLRTLIKERRVALQEISEASGVATSTLGEWTNNRAPKNPVQLHKVTSFLDVSSHYLLFGQEDREDPMTKLTKKDIFSGTFEI